MKYISAELKSRNFLVFILVLQFIVYTLVLFDIPIARQIIGFVYFTTIPGFIIIRLLKLKNLHRLEMFLFSVGFSIAFLMITGLLINELGLMVGISNPLSEMPLLIILNSVVLLFCFLSSGANQEQKFQIAKSLKSIASTPLVVLFLCLPLLSVVGSIWVNTYENNSILLFMIIAISLLFIGVISKKQLPPKFYSLAILMIAISLLFHTSLVSKYLTTFGSDNAIEYFLFETTKNNARWSLVPTYSLSLGYGRINSMLSITILPTLYSTLLNMSATYVLKILYPLIFSLAPLGLYQLWQKNVGAKRAFMATFFFLVQNTFYTEMLGLTRQMIAELFFFLLLLVILNKKMKPFNKTICFVIFSIALVTSHYALAEIFLFFIFLACISLVLMKRPSRNITATMVALFFIVMFAWYIYTSSSAVFNSFLSFGDYVYGQLGNFFNPASRGEVILRGLGLESPPSIWNAFGRVFAYLTELFVVVGFVALITRRIKIQLEREHFTFTVMAAAFLVALIAVPGLANTMNMTRFYHILLFFLAPLCVLGAEFLVKLVSKREKSLGALILLIIILVPYFLFQTDFMYEITGSESRSIPLSSYRMDGYKLYYRLGYKDDWGVFAAQWMHRNVNIQRTQVYADLSSRTTLITYGSTYGPDILRLSNTTKVSANGTVYLGPFNIIHKKIITKFYLCTLEELSFLDDMNKVYTNGGGEIYRNPLES